MAYNKNSPRITIGDQQQDQRLLHALPPVDRPSPLTAVCPRPIPNSYWATPLLLACEYPWTPKNPNKPKLDALLKAGVRTFIDLTESGELLPYAGRVLSSRAVHLGIDPETIEYHRFPIRDRSLPKSVEEMYRVLDVLRDNETRGRISAVHCRGGIGRTGMVIGCWLVQSGVAKDGDEALEVIAKEWRTVEKCNRYPYSPETGPQFEFVQNFHAFQLVVSSSTMMTAAMGGSSSLGMVSVNLEFGFNFILGDLNTLIANLLCCRMVQMNFLLVVSTSACHHSYTYMQRLQKMMSPI